MMKSSILFTCFTALVYTQSIPCIPQQVIPPDGGTSSDTPRFCAAEFEINPSTDSATSQTVEILYVPGSGIDHDSLNLFYSITFTPKEADCYSPTLSFSYYDIDNNDDSDEYIILFIDATTLRNCPYNDTCQLNQCFTELPIPSLDVIPMDTQYTVTIATGDDIDWDLDYCLGHSPELYYTMLAANLTLNCAPVPTSSPTSVTVQPSVSPTTESEEGCDCDCNGNNGDDTSDDSSDETNANAINNELNDKYLDDNDNNMAIGSRLNGDNNNEEENNGTTEEIVISFYSKNAMMNIWALVIGFLVINVVIAWCYCFKSKKTRVTFEDQGGSRV